VATSAVVRVDDEPEIDVSVVLPVFNERGHLVREVDRIRTALDASGYIYELIVVDDGSTDGSTDEAAALSDVQIIRFQRNRGSGSARRAGTRAARGRIVVWTDCDMTYPNDRIPELVKELERGWDQVVGARASERGTVKALRVPAKWFIRKLACYLSETDIPDLNSGLRAFRRDVGAQYLHLLPRGFSCVTTMTLSFLCDGYSVGYVPIDYAKRAGRSKFHWWADTKRYLVQVIRMVLSYNPLRVFLPVGLALLAIGGVKFGYDVITKDFRIATNTLLLLFAGFQVIVIGLLADLVVRVNRRHDLVEPSQQ
jgi:glycosyltransferase involved in cell wall biosynthesis